MSQTVTCEIKLDELPSLEHGTLIHTKSLCAQTPDVFTNDLHGEYFFGATSGNPMDGLGSGHTLVDQPQVKESFGIRIGNTVIEDKALYLAGVSHFAIWN
jgi:hypothetical protein